MKIIKKNKRAFTLVEVMLAIAIIMLIMGLFVSLIYAVRDSFYRTYTSNDAADYAYLYSQAVENYIIKNAEQDPGTPHTYEIDAIHDSQFLCDGTAPFTLTQMVKDGNPKWKIYMYAKDLGNGMISYTLYLVDNYNNPGELVMTYESTLWIPTHGTTQKAPTIKIEQTGAVAHWDGYVDVIPGNRSSVITVTGSPITIPTTAGSSTTAAGS